MGSGRGGLVMTRPNVSEAEMMRRALAAVAYYQRTGLAEIAGGPLS